MRGSDRRKLDRLLSGGPGPSAQEKQAMACEILCGSDARSSASRWIDFAKRIWWAPVAGATAAAALLFIMTLLPGDTSQDEFIVRGGGREIVSMRLVCTRPSQEATAPESGPRKCHFGDTLVFDIQTSQPGQHFSAAALGPDGLLVWYFPSDTRSSMPIEANGVAPRGVIIGPEHVPGDYRVFGLFSGSALSQRRIRTIIEAHAAGKPYPHRLVVERFSLEAP